MMVNNNLLIIINIYKKKVNNKNNNITRDYLCMDPFSGCKYEPLYAEVGYTLF